MDSVVGLVVAILLVLFVIVGIGRAIRIVPQARVGVVERFGKFRTTLPAGLNFVVPFVDEVRYMIDLREQVVSFPPQPVITEDNLVVSIDTVIYFQVTNPVAATYEISNYIQAIEQLTMTTLRNIIGGMALERTLTSREEINMGLRGVLDEATGKWGIRVNRVEIKGIDPPPSIKDAMEKQMRADRDKRAAILNAEGDRQSAILTAEGHKQSAILTAEGDRQAAILRAEGEAEAIGTVFSAIHDGAPDQSVLAYQYLQMLPKIAEGDSSKVWVIPSEITSALGGLGSMLGSSPGIPAQTEGPKKRPVHRDKPRFRSSAETAVAEAIEEAKRAAQPGAGNPPAGIPRGETRAGIGQSSQAPQPVGLPEERFDEPAGPDGGGGFTPPGGRHAQPTGQSTEHHRGYDERRGGGLVRDDSAGEAGEADKAYDIGYDEPDDSARS